VRRRLVIWAAVVGLVAAAGLVGPAAPALATPSHCFEATCDNVALSGTDCATNQLVWDDYVVGTGIAIQLMYSPGCHAFWGEQQEPGGGVYGILFAIPEYGGTEQTLEWVLLSGGAGETHMWNSAGHSVKLCRNTTNTTDPGDTNIPTAQCTGWR
jgi:hypothetical protein